MADIDWAGELARRGLAALPTGSAAPTESGLLVVTGHGGSVDVAGAFSIQGTPVELQIHRVLAGKYNAVNFVGVAVVSSPRLRGTASLRWGQFYSFKRWYLGLHPLFKFLAIFGTPLYLVLFLPGYLMVLAMVTMAKRSAGIQRITDVGSPEFRSRYAINALSREEAEAALPERLQSALLAAEEISYAQVSPGRVALEYLLVGPESLDIIISRVIPPFAQALK